MTAKEGKPRNIARGLVLFSVKLTIAAALVWWLWRDGRLDFSVFARLELDLRTVALFAAGILSVFLGIFLLAWRLKRLLDHLDFDVSFSKATAFTLIGAFFGAVLPGLVGGDAVKAAYLCGHVPSRRMDAFAAIVVDRVIGLYSLLLLGTTALVVAWGVGLVPIPVTVLLITPAAAVGTGAVLALMAWGGLGRLAPVRRAFRLFPVPFQDLVRAFRRCLRSLRLVGFLLLVSMVNHASVVLGFVTAGLVLKDAVTPFAHFVIDPLAMMMNVIPLTPGGIGLAEGAFSYLFQAAGSPNGALIGLLGRLMQYWVFALGGTVALVFVRLRGTKSAETPPESVVEIP
jgi:hypothetical protein